MDLEILKKLGENYSILSRNEDGKTIISVSSIINNIVDQEFSVEIIKYNSEMFDLYSCSRGELIKIDSFKEGNEALYALFFYVKSKFSDTNYNSEIQDKIIQADSLDKEKNIFEKVFNSKKYYSFFENNLNSVNLEKTTENKYNVYIYINKEVKKYLTKDRKMQMGCLVLYNYTIELIKFNELLKEFNLSKEENIVNKLKCIYFS